MADDRKRYTQSDALLPGAGHTPSYGINESSDSADTASTARSSIKTAGGKDRWYNVAKCSLIACLISLVIGMSLGYSSPTLNELKLKTNNHHIDDKSNTASTFGALLPIGAMFGGLLAWPVADIFGRQAALMLGGVPGVIGWVLVACSYVPDARNAFLGLLLSGRFLTGISSGWSVFCVSIYIAEIASAKNKGLFGNCNQLFITIGICITYLFGLQEFGHNKHQISYHYVALVAAAIIAIFEFLMLFTYETPRWLFSKNKDYQGIRVLKILRGPDAHIMKEIDRIKAILRRTYSTREQLMEFRHHSVYHPFILVILLMFFQQFSGINAVAFYSSTIFKSAGFNDSEVELITLLAIGVVQIFATLVAVGLVDKLGRRLLFSASSVGMCLSSFLLGIYFFVYNHICKGCLQRDHHCLNDTIHNDFPCNSSHISFMAIVSVVVFIVSFSIGWGPLTWSSMSELLPNRVRSLGASIATFANWGFATVITYAFSPYEHTVTPKFAWWSFGIVMVASFVFIIVFLPEAKGKSLEEIQDQFERGRVFAISCNCRGNRNRPPASSPINSRHSVSSIPDTN